MKFWEKFLELIYKPINAIVGVFFKVPSFESFLQESFRILDAETLAEIKSFVQNQQLPSGAFANRAGNGDAYYSLFGFFLVEALSLPLAQKKLQNYVENIAANAVQTEVETYCVAILYAKLSANKKEKRKRHKKMLQFLKESSTKPQSYQSFLGLLALRYHNDYVRLFFYLQKWKKHLPKPEKQAPATHIAAEIVLKKAAAKNTDKLVEKLTKYYRKSGGFVAIQNAPIEDLLSTAVSLFALSYAKVDTRIIKPESLRFVDDLYCNGGFLPTQLDAQSDVEYTFYGLLALAALEK